MRERKSKQRKNSVGDREGQREVVNMVAGKRKYAIKTKRQKTRKNAQKAR